MKKRIYISMFTKFFVAFILLGLFPLLLIGQFLYLRLSSSVEDVMVRNASWMAINMGKNIADLIADYNDISKYLYEYTSDEYMYFYQLLEDQDISAEERERQITSILYNMMSMNPSIENIRFIYDKIYNVSRDSTKNLDICKVLDGQWKSDFQELTKLYIMQTHSENNYYYNSNQKVFTLARNYMDVSNMKNARTKRLGTLYIDINAKELKGLEQDLTIGNNSEINIIDSTDGICIYNEDSEKVAKRDQELFEILKYMEEETGVYQTKNDIYAYSNIEFTKWKVIAKMSRQDIQGIYIDSSRFFIGMLTAGLLILLVFYEFSSYANRPVRELKEAMIKIQRGEMDIRVDIKSHDEIYDLGQGFNEMADNLQKYIDKVLIAELRQKEAELAALKSTIKPHYLYNTLEVIRMTALEEDAKKAAELIDSLSKQLRYLIGKESDQVTLEEELQNIQEYFFIVSTRYENRYELEIDVPISCIHLHILKLILQPIVENAVKHGLKPKKGEGKVRITASKKQNILSIIVMDDGVGMSLEQVDTIEKCLHTDTLGVQNEKAISIGIKNTYDRIVKNYGKEYGFEITSYEGIGTIFEYRLPVLEEKKC